MPTNTTVFDVFKRCTLAIREGSLINRESAMDKEFHFQNWVRDRLNETGQYFESGGRNSYPDFRVVSFTEGYEVKGLAYPGRVTSFDSNSQVPTGYHNGRTIFYIFGRYPKKPDGNTYPVLDLVICHGDFLNADHDYVHDNQHVKGFGSYGDILIRDRKMYVVPTPFILTNGTAHTQTLILPENLPVSNDLYSVGRLVRKEADNLIISYTFNLTNNELTTRTIPNPSKGREHIFNAWRLEGIPGGPVTMQQDVAAVLESEENVASKE